MRKILAILGFFWLVLSLTPAGSLAQIAGDANGDSAVNAADVVYQINYLFVNGPPPVFYECGDPNIDCQINSADVAYLINYLFIGGPEPEIVECGWSEPVNLGLPIDSPNGEESFRMTPDARMAVWASNRPGTYGNNDIWYSFWDSVSGSWSEPQNCGPNVNTMAEDLGPCLSPDGKKLYCVEYGRPGGYGSWDIWVSTWDSVNNEWGVSENLGPPINTPGVEWGPFVSPDGSKLYFGLGYILVSEWNDSSWGTPIFLDSTVNRTGSEMYPSITADNKTLYFTSYWYRWCIWVSNWTGTGWGPSELLGPQINDPGGAGQCHITPNGSKLYFISARPGGIGSGDIWMSEKIPIMKNGKHPKNQGRVFGGDAKP